MDETVRAVAWAIAEAWWRKTHRRAAGTVPEANSSQDYADQFWQGFGEEARAAIAAMGHRQAAPQPQQRVASDRFV
ncbi:hypothetical protein [uncultured Enterovirga sp.]|uniref:hypothetical protein n=1 Tax=uncultured Enterovirga sp. TaxID=2026352 RepID=UPI0035CBB90C